MNRREIGSKLVELRGNKPREQVAFELGIGFSALVSYETGKRIPKDDTKVKIANYYNTTVADIFFN